MGKGKRKKPKKTKELKKLLREKEEKLKKLCDQNPENIKEIKKIASEMLLINQEIAARNRRTISPLPVITDHHLREIDEKYAKNVLRSITSDLKCPKCGESFKGNTLNGKPWCFKCNMELTKGGKPPPKIVKDKYPKNVTFKPLD